MKDFKLICEIIIFSPFIVIGYLFYKIIFYFRVGSEMGKL